MTKDEHNKIFKEVCLDNQSAFDFLKMMGKIFRIWDDCWDQDRDHTREEFDDILMFLNFDCSQNEFFCKHEKEIRSFIFLAWNAWKDSNNWRGDEDKFKSVYAWFLRDFCNELVFLVAWLVGGTAHARSLSDKVRSAYLKELKEGGPDGFF